MVDVGNIGTYSVLSLAVHPAVVLLSAMVLLQYDLPVFAVCVARELLSVPTGAMKLDPILTQICFSVAFLRLQSFSFAASFMPSNLSQNC